MPFLLSPLIQKLMRQKFEALINASLKEYSTLVTYHNDLKTISRKNVLSNRQIQMAQEQLITRNKLKDITQLYEFYHAMLWLKYQNQKPKAFEPTTMIIRPKKTTLILVWLNFSQILKRKMRNETLTNRQYNQLYDLNDNALTASLYYARRINTDWFQMTPKILQIKKP